MASVFGSYLLFGTLIPVLMTMRWASHAPHLIHVLIANCTIFIAPFVAYHRVLRRADIVHNFDGSLRWGLLIVLCGALTLVSAFGLMFWLFLLRFGPQAFT
jgi:hypothetical protein